MTRGHWLITKSEVTLRTLKFAVLVSLRELVIENSAIINSGGYVTTIACTTALYRHFDHVRIERVQLRHNVTRRTNNFRMSFVAIGGRRVSSGPGTLGQDAS